MTPEIHSWNEGQCEQYLAREDNPYPVGKQLVVLLHIQLTISFLIGRKCKMNFRNQRLGRHLAADYTIIMSRTLKVTDNHVMYDRDAWFLRIIISSSCALCCLLICKFFLHVYSRRTIYNSVWSWRVKSYICNEYCIYHVKFKVCLVSNPLVHVRVIILLQTQTCLLSQIV